jgi:RNA polymerase sigma-B factor
VSGEFEVQVTEELEVVQAASETVRAEHGSPDRARAREMFERLAVLSADDPERARIRGYLVELHLPLVEYLARRFRNRGEWLDDLTQVATIGLIKSIDRFDLERGVEFSTYATPTIVGEIKRHFRDKGWAVRVPRRLQELKLSLTKAIGDLAQREGRAPTVSELAAHLQMTEEEVLEGLESANAYSTVSLDAPDSGDEDAPAVSDSLGMVDEALEGVEYRESLKPLLEQLPPREKKILLLRFFGNMTQSQIATELGISQMHVSRLLARTLAQLRQGLTTEDLRAVGLVLCLLGRLALGGWALGGLLGGRRGLGGFRGLGGRGGRLRAGRPVEGPQAGRGEHRGQAAYREQQGGRAPRGPVAVQQGESRDDHEHLGHDHRGATPGPGPVQPYRQGRKAGRGAEGDQRQRDPAGRLVGLSVRGGYGREHRRHGEADGLGGLRGRGQAERYGTSVGGSRRHILTPTHPRSGAAQDPSLGGG